MPISELDRTLLRAMAFVQAHGLSKKSDVVLRHALSEAGYSPHDCEPALCNRGDEIAIVSEYYAALRRLALDTPFAQGAGDLHLPAGPRYTECWITGLGHAELERLDAMVG